MSSPPSTARVGAVTSVLRTDSPSHGSSTQIMELRATAGGQPTLRLRGISLPQGQGRRIRWAEDVVDNEGLGRKSSKDRDPSDSSSDSSSSSSNSDSSDDSDSPPDRARRVGEDRKKNNRRMLPHDHNHKHDHDHNHDSDADDNNDHNDKGGKKDGRQGRDNKGKVKGARRQSPNAYERMPKYDKQQPRG
ncbi:MAG: Type 1 phosphatases regulator ypi1 [Cirrosporium novae-zelandiae]|nr:MAG: Type 1 phosphatases regulator ypi1 [Cirrosporium novae-zelandiae]